MYHLFSRIGLYVGLGLFLLLSCTTKKETLPTTALEAARYFIQATLKGDKEEATRYMLQDSLNRFLLNKWGEWHTRLSGAEKIQYKQASIIIQKDSVLNDSTEIIIFSNSYKKQPYRLKVCKHQNATHQIYYNIDLKYTFYEEIVPYFLGE